VACSFDEATYNLQANMFVASAHGKFGDCRQNLSWILFGVYNLMEGCPCGVLFQFGERK
jgi:hypothetical protein